MNAGAITDASPLAEYAARGINKSDWVARDKRTGTLYPKAHVFLRLKVLRAVLKPKS